MKTIGNIMKGQKGIYSMASISVMIIFTSVILVFVSCYGLNYQNGNDVNLSQQGNYSEIIDNADHDKIANLKVDHQDVNTANLDLLTAISNSYSIKVPSTMPVLTIETAKEKRLEIESWMLDGKFFGQPIISFKEELDKPLEIEEWMINSYYFGFSTKTFYEKDLQIESWMISDHFWGY